MQTLTSVEQVRRAGAVPPAQPDYKSHRAPRAPAGFGGGQHLRGPQSKESGAGEAQGVVVTLSDPRGVFERRATPRGAARNVTEPLSSAACELPRPPFVLPCSQSQSSLLHFLVPEAVRAHTEAPSSLAGLKGAPGPRLCPLNSMSSYEKQMVYLKCTSGLWAPGSPSPQAKEGDPAGSHLCLRGKDRLSQGRRLPAPLLAQLLLMLIPSTVRCILITLSAHLLPTSISLPFFSFSISSYGTFLCT